MSYKRANKIQTKHCLEYCTYVVRESEAEEYRKAGVDNLLVIPKDARIKEGSIVYSFMTTFHWIIENTPEDVICIIDDDVKHFNYRLNDATKITKEEFEDPKEVATAEIERIGQLIYDLNLGFACDNPQYALYVYDGAFSFKGMPGAIRWVNKAAFKATYNDNDPATSDVDMMMQELLMNRVILLPKYFHTVATKDLNSGGTLTDSVLNNKYRTAMKNKWGVHYSYDKRRNIAKIDVTR